MRKTVVIVLVFAVGITIGWVASPSQQPISEQAIPALPTQDTAKLAELEAEILRQATERQTLEQNNAELTDRLDTLLRQLDTLQLAQIDSESYLPDAQADEETLSEPTASTQEEPEVSDRRAEQFQRREEMRGRFEDQLRVSLDEQLALLDDPDAAGRVDNLLEWRDYQQEMIQQLREAETEEQRNAIRDEIDEARFNTRRLVNFEQDSLLQGLATEFGVETGQQDLFLTQMRDTLNSPFFTMERALVGGGPGGRPGRGRPN